MRLASSVSHAPKLLIAMLAAVLVVTLLAFWDDSREAEAALTDFGHEQATLAAALGAELGTRVDVIDRDARMLAEASARGIGVSAELRRKYVSAEVQPHEAAMAVTETDTGMVTFRIPVSNESDAVLKTSIASLVSGIQHIERDATLRLYVRAPGLTHLWAIDGHAVEAPLLIDALGTGTSILRVPRPDAMKLGLPPRTAMAGFASVSTASLGRFGMVVLASAERERDRERRALWRLMLAIGVATGLIVLFGGLAFRNQRHELELARGLEVAEITRAAEERLARLSKAATTLTLASGFAHELGTPLGIIVGRAEQLAEKVAGDERSLRSARAILEQAQRIHEVIRGFLGLARSGNLLFQAVDPQAVLRGALDLVDHRFTKAGIGLDTSLPPTAPTIMCDVRLLEHALVNLLLNACDASPAGTTVSVSLEVVDGGVCFVISDCGAGLSAADFDRATALFFTTKPEGKGTGLGLAITNEIVKSHHGRLTMTAQPQGGTVARVQLPLNHGPAHG